MVPFNFLEKKAAYLNTGVWAKKAMKEAKGFGEVDLSLKCFRVLKLMVCPRYSRFSSMLQMVEEPQPYTSLKVLFLFTDVYKRQVLTACPCYALIGKG